MKDWIVKSVPNYSQKLQTQSDLSKFQKEEGISKVYLFSKKKEVPPIFAAITAQFKNRVRFAFVQDNDDESNPAVQKLIEQYGVSTFPTLLMQTNEEGS